MRQLLSIAGKHAGIFFDHPLKNMIPSALRLVLTLLSLVCLTPAVLAQSLYTSSGNSSFTSSAAWNFGNGPLPSSSATGTVGFQIFGSGVTATNDLNLTLQTLQLSNFSTSASTLANAINGDYAFAGAGGIQVNGTGATTLSAPIVIGSTATGLSFSGSGRGSLSVSGVISSSNAAAGAVTINTGGLPTAGAVSLSGANTFTSSSGVLLAGGNLSLGNASALGVFGNALNTLTVTGGTLSSSVSILNPVITSGTDLVLADASGSAGTFAGAVGGNGGLQVRSGGSATVQGFSAINTYTGATVIDLPPSAIGQTNSSNQAGVFNLTSAVGSIAGNTAGISVSSGGTFAINKASGDSVNNLRVSAGNAITSTSGLVVVTGTSGFSTQSLGTVNAGGQTSIVTSPGTGGSAALNISNLVRTNRAVVVLSGLNLGTAAAAAGANVSNINLAQINGAPPTAVLTNGAGFLSALPGGTQAAGTTGLAIIPWAIGDGIGSPTNASIYGAGTGFVTLDSIGGQTSVRLLNATTEYNTGNNFTTAVPTDNVRVTAATTGPAAPTTVNSIFVGITGLNMGAAGMPITVTSGAVASNVAAATFDSPLTGASELVISSIGTLATANTITANGALTAPTLTKGGQGTLILGSGSNAFLSNLITVNGGFLQVTNLNQLGISQAAPGSSTIMFNLHSFQNQGGLNYNTGTSDTLNSNLVVNSGHLKLNANAAGTTLNVAGLISGNGGVNINSDTAGATIVLSNGANTFKGGVRIGSSAAQNFRFGSDGALGDATGAITIADAASTTMKLSGAWTTSRNVAFQGALGSFDTNGFASTWSGPITGSGNMTRVDSSGAPSTWSITGANNPYTGTITLGSATLSGGTLSLSGAGELSSASIVVGVAGTPGAAFDISGASGARRVASLASVAGTTITLGANDLIVGGGGTIAGTITGTTGRLIKAGTGTLALTNFNNHTGTEIWGGVLSITDDANLGVTTGMLALRGGTLAVTTNSVAFSASRPVVFDATPVMLGGTAPANGINVLGSGFDLAIPGAVSGAGGFEKTGVGSVTFSGTNTSGSSLAAPGSGLVKISQGAVVFNSDSNLGRLASGSFPGTRIVLQSLSGQSIFAAADFVGTLRLAPGNGAVTINRFIAFANANTNQAAIDVGTGSALTFSGTLAGAVNSTTPQTLFKTGAGTLTFDANAAQFGANFSIGNGTTATGNVSLTAGSNLSRANIALAASSGATLDMSNLAKEFGNLSLATGTTVQLGSSGTLTTGWNNSAAAIAGTITSTGASTINQVGSGTYTYSAAQTFTGSYHALSTGGTTLSGSGSFAALNNLTIGSIGGTSNLGATLTLDNFTTNLDTRLAATQAILLNNSNLSFTGNAATPTNQVADSYKAAGATIVTMAGNGGTLNFSNGATGYARIDRGTTLVRASVATLGSGAASVTIPNLLFGNLNTGSLVGLGGGTGVQTPILPFMAASDTASSAATGNTFATIGPNGIVPLSTTTGYSATFVDANTNVRAMTSATFSGANGTANALILAGTANTMRLDSAVAETLVVNAGAIANTTNQVYTANTNGTAGTVLGIQTSELQTGAGNTRELIVHNLNADLAIGARITTTGGLTKTGGYTAGGSTLYLTNASNSYTGGTVVDGGTLTIDSLAAINPTASNGLTLSGGYLKYRGPSATFPAGVPFRLGGGSATNPGATGGINVVSGTTLTISTGTMTGFGGLVKDGTGVLYVQGAQTFSGPVVVQSGAYAIDNAGGLGSNSRVLFDTNAGGLAGAAVQFRANGLTIAKDFSILSGSATIGAGFDTMGNDATISGVISSSNNNSKGIYKLGDGNLTLTGANTYFGSTQVFSGNLILAGANGSVLNSGANSAGSAFIATGTFDANIGGGIILDNRNASGGNNNNRLPDPFTTTLASGDAALQTGLRLNGGDFTVRGNEFAATSEVTNRVDIFTSTITLENNGQNVSLTTGRVNRASAISAGLIRGTNLGAVPSSTSSNWFAVDEGAQSVQLGGAGGAIGTPFVSILPGFMGDSSATGVGTDLVTYDSAVGFRRLTASEYTSTFAGSSAAPNLDASRAPNIALSSGTTTAPAFTHWTTAIKLAAGAVLNGTGTINLTQGTVLATGSATINATNLESIGNGGYIILTPGAATNLALNSTLSGSGLSKYGGGTLTFGGAVQGGGNIIVEQGSLVLSGANAYLAPNVLLGVVRGASFDLGGFDRLLPAPTFLSTLGTTGLNVIQDGTINLGANNYSITSTNSTLYTGSMVGSGGFRKLAFSTGSTSFAQPIAYTGTTFIGAGTIALPLNGTLATSLIDIRGGGLTLNNGDDNGIAGGYVAQRIPAATPINLAGTITVTGNANTPGVHQFGSLTLVGNGTITPTPGANAPITLTFANISRTADRGTLVAGGTNLGLAQSPSGGSRVFATTINGGMPSAALVGGAGADGTTTVSILPWAWSSTASSFMTYGGNGLRPLSTIAGVESEANLDAPSGPNANIRTTAAAVLSGPREVNSLVQTTGGVSGAFDLTLRSGALATTIANTIGVNTNTLRTGVGGANATELVVFNSAATTLAYNLTTSGGVTKYGTGTLTLSGTNTFTGGLSVQSGLVSFSNDNQLGAAGGLIRFGAAFGVSGSGLTYVGTAGAPLVTNRPLITNSEAAFSHTLTNQIWAFTGGISGPGSVHYNYSASGGAVVEPGNNTYTGGTQIFEGIIAIRGDGTNADSSFGNGGPLDIDATSPGGIVQLANWTTSRPLSISFSSTLNTNGFNATWTGSVTGGASILTKAGIGTLTLTSPTVYTAATGINGGEVRLRDRGAVLGGFTVNAGAQLTLDDTGTHSADRIPDGSAVTSTSADLRLLGNSAMLSEEVIGSLTLNTAAKVTLVPGSGQAAILRLGSTGVLTRGTASSILFRGTNLGVNAPGTSNSANVMIFNPAASSAILTGGGGPAGNSAISIIAGAYGDTSATGNGTQLVTYDYSRGIRLLDSSEYANALNNGTAASDNIHLTATSTSIANPTAVNALWLDSGATINTTAATGIVTITAGNILATGSGNVISGATGGITVGATALAFGGPGNLTVSSSLPATNTGGLIKTGDGTLTLSGPNAYTGTTTISSGTVVVGNNAAFSAGLVRFLGGAIQGDGTPRTLSNAVALSGNFTIGGSSDLTFSTGAWTLENATRTITVTGSGVTTINSVIGQSGIAAIGLTKDGPGLLVLAGNNTYGTSAAANGAFYGSKTTVNGGDLRISGQINGAASGTNSGTGGSALEVNISGKLSGSGWLVPQQTTMSRNTLTAHLGGTIAPSLGVATGLKIGNSQAAGPDLRATVSLEAGSIFEFQYSGSPIVAPLSTGGSATAGANNSLLTVFGTLNVDSGLTFKITGNANDFPLPHTGYSFQVATASTALNMTDIGNQSRFDTSAFANFTPGLMEFTLTNFGGAVYLNVVPEPSTAVFGLMGVAMLLVARFRPARK
ncbi:MAG: fibronectin-binding autotransporter adhesin [Chthoniobacter sp.]|jgi:autotransporter-associated beta strand protein|nr:fibronectin-binding autotransporter adhesin [Chthoniobacter sp.]